MSKKVKSAKIRTLLNDGTFQEVMSEVANRQIAVFVRVDSTMDERDRAHDIIRALREIEDYTDSVMADEAIQNHKDKLK